MYTMYLNSLQIIAFERVESDCTPQLANALHNLQKTKNNKSSKTTQNFTTTKARTTHMTNNNYIAHTFI